MKYAVLSFAILSGCAKEIRPDVTAGGVQVEIRADVVESDHASILLWVDLRLEEWIRNKSAWGCDRFTDEELRILARAKRVVVYPGYVLPGRDGAMGWNSKDHPVIDVAVNFPPMILNDWTYNGVGVGVVPFDYSYGLRELPHEWTHTARGEWH
jgi:hypothetical protein